MDVSAWYIILAIVVLIMAVMERFVVYKILLGARQWLPEKAGNAANICTALTVFVGFAALLGNAVLSKR